MHEALTDKVIPLELSRKYMRLVQAYQIAYKYGMNIVQTEKWLKSHRAHRSHSNNMDEEIEQNFLDAIAQKKTEFLMPSHDDSIADQFINRARPTPAQTTDMEVEGVVEEEQEEEEESPDVAQSNELSNMHNVWIANAREISNFQLKCFQSDTDFNANADETIMTETADMADEDDNQQQYSEDNRDINQEVFEKMKELYFPTPPAQDVAPNDEDEGNDIDDVVPDDNNIIDEIAEEIDEELDNTRIRNNSPYIDLAPTMGLENIENLIENDIEDEIIFNRIYDVKRSGIITRSKGLSKGLENDNIESLESLSNRPVDDDDNNMTFLDLVQDNRLNIEKPSSKRYRKKSK